ncbi:MAG: protein-L-isoaspartate(D-aspartate) O-methyltransferase [Candidatus Cyclobacteriaceae bacterium M3_2C_046]
MFEKKFTIYLKISGIILIIPLFFSANLPTDNDFQKERQQMVNQQIKGRGIYQEKILNAMLQVPRHQFVPDQFINQAYEDRPLSIGHGQTISQPYIVALMTKVLQPEPEDKVLEVGTGSGYQAAILSQLVDQVYSVEIIEPLAKNAKEVVNQLNLKNVIIRQGDGYRGWPEKAPFDAIIVTCSPSHIPQPLIEQLKEGGKMVIPVGDSSFTQELVLLSKQNGKIKRQEIIPVRFVPMNDSKGERY